MSQLPSYFCKQTHVCRACVCECSGNAFIDQEGFSLFEIFRADRLRLSFRQITMTTSVR